MFGFAANLLLLLPTGCYLQVENCFVIFVCLLVVYGVYGCFCFTVSGLGISLLLDVSCDIAGWLYIVIVVGLITF